MNFADTQKPYLRSYELMANLEGFFRSAGARADRYTYVSSTERRCFNLSCKLTDGSGRDRLVSNYGLLLQHRKIAQQYAATGRFPRIHLIDDMLVHGRGLGKFLHRLETLLEQDLREMMDSLDMGDFRRKLLQAIDISIFARCDRPLLLEEQYLDRIQAYLLLPSKQIHDLSIQLTDALTRFEVANTCFVYSGALGGIPSANVPSLWRRMEWEYQREPMILYVRPFAKGRVSTIRCFPNRYSDPKSALFTSFTMLGNLSASLLNRCVEQVAAILVQAGSGYEPLCRILWDKAPQVRSSKAQLLYFLCSAIDFQDFCSDIGKLFSADWENDLDKISRNFGICSEIQPALRKLINSPEVLKQIQQQVYPMLDGEAESLGFPAENAGKETRCEAVNRCIREIFYEIGIASEETAVYHTDTTYRFSPDAYQSYHGQMKKERSDGILSVKDFNQIADGYDALRDPYCRIAGFIAAMDCGIMGARVQGATHIDMECALCKAGEMSTAYGPEQMAVALPAFELLERFSRKIDMTPLDAIMAFCDSLSKQEMRSYLSEEHFERVNGLLQRHPELFEELPALARRYCPMMYRGGHRIQDWNFENLITQPDRGWMIYQWYLQKKALEFLSLPQA